MHTVSPGNCGPASALLLGPMDHRLSRCYLCDPQQLKTCFGRALAKESLIRKYTDGIDHTWISIQSAKNQQLGCTPSAPLTTLYLVSGIHWNVSYWPDLNCCYHRPDLIAWTRTKWQRHSAQLKKDGNVLHFGRFVISTPSQCRMIAPKHCRRLSPQKMWKFSAVLILFQWRSLAVWSLTPSGMAWSPLDGGTFEPMQRVFGKGLRVQLKSYSTLAWRGIEDILPKFPVLWQPPRVVRQKPQQLLLFIVLPGLVLQCWRVMGGARDAC